MNVHHGLDNLPAFKNAVLTIGSFDGVHEGHRSIITQICQLARQKGGESILLTFDPHPRHVLDPQDKGLALLNTLNEKLRLLRNTGIDHVVVVPFTFEFSQLTKEEYLRKVIIDNFDPAAIVIGYDHRFGMNRQGGVHFLREEALKYGYQVIEINEARVHKSKVSSTEVRTALRNKEVIKANQLLGYPYHLTGNVVQGLKLGSKLGYPTANISIQDKHKLIPDEGVYAVKIRIDGKWYQGMMYIGQRPTLKKNYGRTIEVNIFDFHGDIYGEKVKVELKAYIRGDLKFDDLEMLKRQISDDERVVKRLFHRMDDDSTKLTKCAIVILNYNGRQHLETYLPSVLAKSKGSEIIIADNQSTDDSLTFLSEHFPDIQLIVLDKNYGFAGGYNEALKQIKAKYYILLNSDIEPGEGFPGTLIEMLDSDPEISAVQPKVRSWKNKSSFEYAGAAGGYMDLLGYPLCRGRVLETTEEDEGQYDTVEEVFWATGCAMAIRSNLFHKLGGFDDWYFAHQEEIDLCWRMKRAGYKVMVEPKATVYHLGGGTLDYLSTKKTYLNFKNSLANIFKNQPIVLALPLVLIRLILDGAASVYFLSKGQSSHVLAVLKSHLHFYLGLPKLIQKKLYFNQLVNRTRCGPSRTKFGSLHLSIVFEYYLRGKKTFKDLIS